MTIAEAEAEYHRALVALREAERDLRRAPDEEAFASCVAVERVALDRARRALRKAHEAARADVLPEMDALQAAIAAEAKCRAAGTYTGAELQRREEAIVWQSRGWETCPKCESWKRRGVACSCPHYGDEHKVHNEDGRVLPEERGREMKRVYVAGPVGANDAGRIERVNAAIDAGAALMARGFAPFVPHLFHFFDENHPAGYEDWMRLCFSWLDVCDAVLRIPGASPGADREVARARERGIPVYFAIGEIDETT